jgi:hypothetical protein
MGYIIEINNNRFVRKIKLIILTVNLAIANIIINAIIELNKKTNNLIDIHINELCNLSNIQEMAEEIIEIQYYYTNLVSKPNNAYLTNEQSDDFLIVQSFRDNILLEYIWAIFPSLVIFLILIPSLYLLYSMEENMNPRFNIKVIGHQ